MNKKLLISLAIVAFAVTPAAAQATAPHWYADNVFVTGAPNVHGWGVLTLASTTNPGKFVECEVSEAGTVSNPGGVTGPAGVDAINMLVAFGVNNSSSCVSALTCPPAAPEAFVTGYPTSGPAIPNLPKWPSVLEEQPAGVIRDKITGVNVRIECFTAAHGFGGSVTYVGSTAPCADNGTSALFPSFLEWCGGSGELEQQGSGGTIKAKLEGEVQFLGNFGELISVKNP
jgi:hypothetical protein